MSATALMRTIQENGSQDVTGWLVFADWFKEREIPDAEAYCRMRAAFISHEQDRPNRKRPDWGSRDAYRNARRAWQAEGERLKTTHGSEPELHACSPGLLWLRWEDGSPEVKTVLFAHHCFLTGQEDLLWEWLNEIGPQDGEDGEYMWESFREAEFHNIRRNGRYDLSSFIGPGNIERATQHHLFPETNPFESPL